MSEKTSREEANERGQRDGSTGDGYGYNGWLYSGDELEIYNKAYDNGRSNPAPEDEDDD